MYRIIKKLDGRYLEICSMQGDTEKQYHETKKAAIANLILGAKILNNAIISVDDIKFGVEQQAIKTEIIWSN